MKKNIKPVIMFMLICFTVTQFGVPAFAGDGSRRYGNNRQDSVISPGVAPMLSVSQASRSKKGEIKINDTTNEPQGATPEKINAIATAGGEIKATRKKIKEADGSIKALRKDVRALYRQREKAEGADLNQIDAEIKSKLDELGATKTKANDLKGQLEAQVKRKTTIETVKQKYNSGAMVNVYTNPDEALSKLSAKIEELQGGVKTTKEDVKKYKEDLAGLMKQYRENKKTIKKGDDAQGTLANLKTDIDSKKKQIKEAKNNIKQMGGNLVDAKQDTKQINATGATIDSSRQSQEVADIKSKIDTKKTEIGDKAGAVKKAKSDIAGLKKSMKGETKQEKKQTKEEIVNKRKEINQANADKKELRGQLATLKSGKAKAVKVDQYNLVN